MRKPKSMKDRVKEFSEEKKQDTDRTVMLNVRVPKSLSKSLKVWAAANEISMQAHVISLLEKDLKEKGAL